MTKRILAFAAIFGVFVSAVLTVLSILDVITADQLRETLGKTSLVIAVTALAVVLMLAIGRLGLTEPDRDGGDRGSR